MFTTETRTITSEHTRTLGHAVCDRCGHVMDQADIGSGYHNLTLLRFRAGSGSKFGDDRYVEGDFCDACLFELVARYVRVIDDDVAEPPEPFSMESPRRLYAEHQVDNEFAQHVLMSLRGWIAHCFDPKHPRWPLIPPAGARRPGSEAPAAVDQPIQTS
jgi:hypothetical protein